MRLARLKLSRAGQVIREIQFKEGLNLIIDTPTDSNTQSGNNVGKTTVLRLIDYCLGSDGSDIWQDPEFKKVNQEIYDFLHGVVPVTVTLTLVTSGGLERILERRFVAPRAKVESSFVVDGEVHRNLKDYQVAVKGLLFGSVSAKPTLRQLMPKFIRSNSTKMSRTLKFHTDHTSEVSYEAIHLFLFGFFDVDVLEERPRLDALQKKQARDLQAFTRDREEGEIEQLLFHLRREIEEIEHATTLRGEVPELTERATAISQVRAQAANLSGDLSSIQAEISSIEIALREFKRDFSSVDAKVVESVYKEAQSFIPELHAKWEELTDFVHNLRKRKERFLASQKEHLERAREELVNQLMALEKVEAERVNHLTDSAEFQHAIAIRADLLEKAKRLGSLEQHLEDIRALKTAIASTADRITETQKRIEAGRALLQERLKIFNSHFSAYSKLLYGEQYLLHAEANPQGTFVFKLSAVGANVGTGKKASQTAAFDFAYCKFLQDAEIAFPSFICHDGLEAIHDNQLRELLSTATSFGGQIVVATLRDKLPSMPGDFVQANTILTLAQDDKLFKV